MDKRTLGGQIRRARRDRGITGDKLSEACEIDAAYLRQIEGGTRTPSLPVFVALCKALKVSPSYLLAEALPDSGAREMDALLELWRTATPSQIKIIAAMVQSALDILRE